MFLTSMRWQWSASCLGGAAVTVAALMTQRAATMCEKEGPYWDPEPLERAAKVFREINERPNAKQVSLFSHTFVGFDQRSDAKGV